MLQFTFVDKLATSKPPVILPLSDKSLWVFQGGISSPITIRRVENTITRQPLTAKIGNYFVQIYKPHPLGIHIPQDRHRRGFTENLCPRVGLSLA